MWQACSHGGWSGNPVNTEARTSIQSLLLLLVCNCWACQISWMVHTFHTGFTKLGASIEIWASGNIPGSNFSFCAKITWKNSLGALERKLNIVTCTCIPRDLVIVGLSKAPSDWEERILADCYPCLDSVPFNCIAQDYILICKYFLQVPSWSMSYSGFIFYFNMLFPILSFKRLNKEASLQLDHINQAMDILVVVDTRVKSVTCTELTED